MPQRDRFMKPKKQKPMRHLDKKEQDAFHEAFRSSFRPVEEDIKQKLECEKCGEGNRIVTHYCANTEWGCRNYKHNSKKEEHLHYACRACYWDWIGPVKKEGKK